MTCTAWSPGEGPRVVGIADVVDSKMPTSESAPRRTAGATWTGTRRRVVWVACYRGLGCGAPCNEEVNANVIQHLRSRMKRLPGFAYESRSYRPTLIAVCKRQYDSIHSMTKTYRSKSAPARFIWDIDSARRLRSRSTAQGLGLGSRYVGQSANLGSEQGMLTSDYPDDTLSMRPRCLLETL